ncbi:hypothetical protein PMIN06_012346 [Paraphaeosphaeria minitans]
MMFFTLELLRSSHYSSYSYIFFPLSAGRNSSSSFFTPRLICSSAEVANTDLLLRKLLDLALGIPQREVVVFKIDIDNSSGCCLQVCQWNDCAFPIAIFALQNDVPDSARFETAVFTRGPAVLRWFKVASAKVME